MTEQDISWQPPIQVLFEWLMLEYQLATYYLFVGI